MFGLVTANLKELSKEEKHRYNSIYCGICRQIKEQCSSSARLGLSYDMAFLALLLMSLYEPEETSGSRACKLHPIKPRSWVDSEIIRYCACMNVALGYYNALDDYQDEGKFYAKALCNIFGRDLGKIKTLYPRQCEAIENCLSELRQLEAENCPNPDLPAGCFGKLLGELFVYREDLWADTLRNMGHALGRYIYLADGIMDYRRDQRRKQYNPFSAMGAGENYAQWYYLSALAHNGLGNQVTALEHIRRAVSMDPGNYTYLQALNAIENGGTVYRQQAGNYRGYFWGGSSCGSLCLCYLVQLIFCRGRIFFCC